AARVGSGLAQARYAQVSPARSQTAVESRIDRVVAKVDRNLGGFTAALPRQLAQISRHYGQLNPPLPRAHHHFRGFFRHTLAAVDGGIAGEAQAAQGTLQATTGPVRSAVEQAGTSGASAQAQAQAAPGQLADDDEAQRAADQAAVARFWDRYYSSFNPLRAEMAAIASAQSPSVHLSRGRVTGPQGHRTGNHRGINGTGTGTVTFTGLPGGAGFGLGSGVA